VAVLRGKTVRQGDVHVPEGRDRIAGAAERQPGTGR